MDYFTTLLQLLPFVVVFYWYVTKKLSYWSERGLNGPKPAFLIGTIIPKLRNTVEIENEWRNRYGRVYGVFAGLQPVLTITDAELVKQMMIKDFAQFMNRRKNNFYHEVMSENLFNLEDDKWKALRTVLTPSFTSGKLRGMQVLMNRAVDKLNIYFDKLTGNSSTPKVFVTKEVMTGFTVDVIASTIFATDTNANDDRVKMSPFVRNALDIFKFNVLKIVPLLAFPLWLNNLLGFKLGLDGKATNFFIGLCRQIVNERKSNPNLKRADLVQSLIDAKVELSAIADQSFDKLAASIDEEKTVSISTTTVNVAKKSLTDNEVVAQCMLFFIAGFETTASTLSFALHELAVNPDCQERLVEEIRAATSEIEDETSEEYFEIVTTKVPYLEAVMKETLRKYPSVIRLERRAGHEGIKLGNVELHKDQLVEVSAYAIHHDPEYYPDPENWNPDRFMPENKSMLVPYTYLPFGLGPRNCVGMRFAYQEVKLCLARLVTRHRFSRAPTTNVPVNFMKGAFLLSPTSLDLAVERR